MIGLDKIEIKYTDKVIYTTVHGVACDKLERVLQRNGVEYKMLTKEEFPEGQPEYALLYNPYKKKTYKIKGSRCVESHVENMQEILDNLPNIEG